MTGRSRLKQRTSVALLFVNMLGAYVCLQRAALSWPIPEVRRYGLNGLRPEPFIWFAAVYPMFAAFLLLNVTWGALIIYHRQWRMGQLWLLAAVSWLVGFMIDYFHHVI